jgi:heparin binding hemagglutinin HbhA
VTEIITHQKENIVAKARFDIPTQLPNGVTRPLYAGIGVTDRVVEVVREAVADVQKRAEAVQKDVQKTVSGLDYRPLAIRDQAAQVVTSRVDSFGKDAQARRRAVEQRVAGLQADAKDLPVRLQKLVDDQVATAGTTFEELVKRGETLVGRIRRQPATTATTSAAKTTTAKAKTTRTQATKTAKAAKRSTTRTTKKAAKSPARSSAKATATSARETAASAARAAGDAAQKVGD